MEDIKTILLDCPICGKKSLTQNFFETTIPYFGKIAQISVICSECGYRHNDFIFLDSKEPARLKLEVCGEEDLNIRVARSASATILIPELGVKIEPGVTAEAFISNVEGVFNRIINVLMQLFRDGNESEKARITEILTTIAKVRRGKESVTLIFEDPTGNSKMLSDKVVKE